MGVLKVINSCCEHAFTIAGAFFGSQIPLFMQVYSQQLTARVAELSHLLNELKLAAAKSNKTLSQYIDKFTQSNDPDFVSQGQFMEGLVKRFNDFQLSLMEISESSMWTRPYYFLKHYHEDVIISSYDSFVPGFTFTVEEIGYTIFGALFGFAIYRIILNLIPKSKT